ncbi:hypothetical protein HFE03_03650 [Paenibacillus sp. EKM102P]|uniref:hypothetical protein n=2 Tax=Paenibacillus TaxID=44249 RepID=UPI00142D421A|nr:MULTISPECIES: hypothetical protein [unclassified Paenibacillus]KAF6618304.1 hypothetical protein HFE00_09485 [Paenibacillus sp. EKM101P]KAF6624650.1 hypothetical protein HFE03_03650 [Paenibacillus sp. EKM102P]KAF6635571.1 hypothetical protein HFE01_01380 [Paenibacillus sp. EKM10P]KAF6648719.1 hypothetical protein HFE02_10170 [Paenibacillus sp. EKM11P]
MMHMQVRCKGSSSYADLCALSQVGGQAIEHPNGTVIFKFSSDVTYQEYRRIRREQKEGAKRENAVRTSYPGSGGASS